IDVAFVVPFDLDLRARPVGERRVSLRRLRQNTGCAPGDARLRRPTSGRDRGVAGILDACADYVGGCDARAAERTGDAVAQVAAENGLQHALVIGADERTTDAVVLRIVEQAHGASDRTTIVIHPGSGSSLDRDRRWMTMLERAAAVHSDVRLAIRLPPPTGMR